MQLPRACEAIAEAIQELPGDPRYTIFMVHGGVEGIIPGYRAEIQRDQLSCLEPAVDYLALGHIHKPFTNLELDAPGRGPALENWARRRASTSVQLTSQQADDADPRRHPWILNPGSLDCWRMDEADWRHGFYDVEIDLDLPGRHRVKHVAVERRRVLVVRQSIDECASQSDLEDRLLRTLVERRDGLDPREPGVVHDLAPIVHVVLEGHLKFDRRHLDLNALEDQVRATFDPLVVEVKNQTRSIQYSAIDLLHGDGLPLDRAALEQQVIESLLANDIRLAPFRETLAGVALELKAYALGEVPDADLAERVLDAYRHSLGAEPSPVGAC
jgi:DNA repair exonuclease SbcCD nuclease subunit